jgi:uncharacterized protein (TIGR03067 family)
MRTYVSAVLAVGLAAIIAAAQAGGGDAEKIQGTWIVVSLQDGGKQAPEKEIEGTRLIVTKDKMTLSKPGGEEDSVGYTLDATKKPKWVDLTTKDGKKMLGIYELDGDNLKFCFNEKDDAKRADKFESAAGSPNDVLVILKREKKK